MLQTFKKGLRFSGASNEYGLHTHINGGWTNPLCDVCPVCLETPESLLNLDYCHDLLDSYGGFDPMLDYARRHQFCHDCLYQLSSMRQFDCPFVVGHYMD